ncbi:hypothetical protein BLOT_014913 [Blomia tropicalis]|nr:hypothetical protein BLOT_014913 [Blomia tropicalis]
MKRSCFVYICYWFSSCLCRTFIMIVPDEKSNETPVDHTSSSSPSRGLTNLIKSYLKAKKYRNAIWNFSESCSSANIFGSK